MCGGGGWRGRGNRPEALLLNIMPSLNKYNKYIQSKEIESEEEDATLYWVVRESLTDKVTFNEDLNKMMAWRVMWISGGIAC